VKIRRCWVAAAALLASPSSSVAADLSPARWPMELRTQLQQGEYSHFPLSAGIVTGRSVLVTGTSTPMAVHAGMEALRQGGTAADAAATVALTQIASDLGSVVSYAGVAEVLYFEAQSGKVYALDASWGTYAGETDPASIPPTDTSLVTGRPATAAAGSGALGRQTLVPGFMAGLAALHTRFGRLKFGELFQPAIWYADHGVTISPTTAAWFQMRRQQLWRTPAGRAFASMSDGSLPKAGEVFHQPDLAKTLKAVASAGAGYLYTGAWAHSFVDAVRAEGGRVELEDLARYKPVWREPLTTRFGSAVVFGPGENAGGSCPVLESLNLLSALRIGDKGPYWRDPQAFKDYAAAFRFTLYGHYLPTVAAFEKEQGFNTGCKSRLSPEYAAAVAPRIPSLLTVQASAPQAGHHTESVVVVDRWGNVAALVHSINAVVWGDTGIVVGGIPIPDAAAINQQALLNLKPGELVPGAMSPVIALLNGKPLLAVAAVGSSNWMETTRLVAGVLAGAGSRSGGDSARTGDDGRDLQALMSAPPLLLNVNPLEPGQTLLQRPEVIPANAYDARFLKDVAAAGIGVTEENPLRTLAIRGTAVMAVLDQPSGAPRAVEIPGVMGFAESDRHQGAPPAAPH